MNARTLLMNVAALAAYLAIGIVVYTLSHYVPEFWMKETMPEVLAGIGGLLLAIRLKARIAMWVVAAFLGYSVSMFIVHATWGFSYVQGRENHVAVLLASFVSALVTVIVFRSDSSVRASQ